MGFLAIILVKLNSSNFNKLRIEVDGNFGTDTSHWRVDGYSNSIGGSTSTTRYIGISPSSKLAYGNQNDTVTTFTDSDTTGRHHYVVDYKKGYVKRDGDTIVTFTPYNYTHVFETDLFIFTYDTGGTKQKSAKKYGVKFLFDDVLAFNGIPAKRKSDNVIGMYDMVSRQFFTNSGTGSFTGA